MSDEEKSICMYQDYVRSITNIMNVIGVDEMVRILRRSADDLEANAPMLEWYRTRNRQQPRGQA